MTQDYSFLQVFAGHFHTVPRVSDDLYDARKRSIKHQRSFVAAYQSFLWFELPRVCKYHWFACSAARSICQTEMLTIDPQDIAYQVSLASAIAAMASGGRD